MPIATMDRGRGAAESADMMPVHRVLSQLLPFNENRFDAAISYLSGQHNRALSKYEIVKLHVLMDIYHTLETGTPIVGGTLQAWDRGPVVRNAYERLDDWCTDLEQAGKMPEGFTIRLDGDRRVVAPTFSADPDDFSANELKAMDDAWNKLMPMMDRGQAGYEESQRFFHSDETFIGRAYNKARLEERDIDWNDLIDAYDQLHGTNHEDVKLLMTI